MKISINTPIARIEANLSDEQVKELLQIAVAYVTSGTGSVSRPVDAAQTAEPLPRVVIPQADTKPKQEPTAAGYKGFLHIKCGSCGKVKGFCVKNHITEHRCECGNVEALVDLKPMYVNCKCGEQFKYMTNMTDGVISIDCISCGSPVDLELNEKKRVYQTIGGPAYHGTT